MTVPSLLSGEVRQCPTQIETQSGILRSDVVVLHGPSSQPRLVSSWRDELSATSNAARVKLGLRAMSLSIKTLVHRLWYNSYQSALTGSQSLVKLPAPPYRSVP